MFRGYMRTKELLTANEEETTLVYGYRNGGAVQNTEVRVLSSAEYYNLTEDLAQARQRIVELEEDAERLERLLADALGKSKR